MNYQTKVITGIAVLIGTLIFSASAFATEIRKETYPNGRTKSEITYEGGVKEGPFTTYYEDGTVKSKGTYRQEKLNGTFKKYSAKGELSAVTEFKDDKQNGVLRVYFPDGKGKISAEWPYRDDKPYGVWKSYYESGKIQGEMAYGDNGTLDGVSRTYYETGGVRVESTFRDNALIHKKIFKEDGSLVSDKIMTEQDRQALSTKNAPLVSLKEQN